MSIEDDARQDISYANGFHAGFNAGYQAGVAAEKRDGGQVDDPERVGRLASLWRSMESRRHEALKVLRAAGRLRQSQPKQV
jgi:hypothetical protein